MMKKQRTFLSSTRVNVGQEADEISPSLARAIRGVYLLGLRLALHASSQRDCAISSPINFQNP